MPKTIAAVALAFLCAGCLPEQPTPPTVKMEQANKAAQAANSIKFSENAEIENIKDRLELTSQPGLLGYVVLFNESGVPILYEGVKGKITSGGKRLTPPDVVTYASNGQTGRNMAVHRAPSDEGTYGESSQYIFYRNTDGIYRQWSGHYLYSTQPIRLRIEPLVINVK